MSIPLPNYNSLSHNYVTDMIHRLRLAADKYNPSPSTLLKYAAPFMGGPGVAALTGASQGDILPPRAPAAPPSPPGPASPQPNPANWGSLSYPPSPPQAPAPTPQSAPQAPNPAQSASIPMPQARPAVAPQPQPQPDMNFFQRNAAMMRDPSTGAFIDPMGAARAVRGPDLISKMMDILHKKATG